MGNLQFGKSRRILRADTTFVSPAFGTIARALPSRSMQVALKLYW